MTKRAPMFLAAVLAAVISIFLIAPWLSSPVTHQAVIESIDGKIDTVMKLTASSTTASALISAMPGDTATPIAEKLADLSTYFLLVLCVLYLEKYLITVTGAVAFRVLLPLALAALGVGLFWNRGGMRRLAGKLGVFGIALFLLVPVSVRVSDMIYDTYATSIQDTIDAAEDEDLIPMDDSTGDMANWFVDRVSNLTNTASGILNRFVEALAVMIVTCCAIPLVVLVFLLWLVRVVLGIHVPVISLNGKELRI